MSKLSGIYLYAEDFVGALIGPFETREAAQAHGDRVDAVFADRGMNPERRRIVIDPNPLDPQFLLHSNDVSDDIFTPESNLKFFEDEVFGEAVFA